MLLFAQSLFSPTHVDLNRKAFLSSPEMLLRSLCLQTMHLLLLLPFWGIPLLLACRKTKHVSGPHQSTLWYYHISCMVQKTVTTGLQSFSIA